MLIAHGSLLKRTLFTYTCACALTYCRLRYWSLWRHAVPAAVARAAVTWSRACKRGNWSVLRRCIIRWRCVLNASCVIYIFYKVLSLCKYSLAKFFKSSSKYVVSCCVCHSVLLLGIGSTITAEECQSHYRYCKSHTVAQASCSSSNDCS
jgi:hypothetical protein